jgi:hypothetical protein
MQIPPCTSMASNPSSLRHLKEDEERRRPTQPISHQIFAIPFESTGEAEGLASAATPLRGPVERLQPPQPTSLQTCRSLPSASNRPWRRSSPSPSTRPTSRRPFAGLYPSTKPPPLRRSPPPASTKPPLLPLLGYLSSPLILRRPPTGWVAGPAVPERAEASGVAAVRAAAQP